MRAYKNTISDSRSSLIILDTFYDYFLASVARYKLNENGIKCYVEENAQMNFPGSIELKIHKKDLSKAFKILSE
jgi:hypothetical protein